MERVGQYMADTSDMGFDFGIAPAVDMQIFDNRVRMRTQAHMAKLATVLSGQMEGKGRTVKKVIVQSGAGCSTDGEVIRLDFPITGFVQNGTENMIVTEAILAHEAAGHLRYTNFNAWKRMIDAIKRGKEDKLMSDFVNIVEDARVNYLLGKDFAGSKKRLDYAQRKMMQATRAKLEGKVIADDDRLLPQYGVIAIATEVIIAVPHFVNNQKVIDMMDEMRPMFSDAIASQDTSRVIKKCRAMMEIYRKYFPEPNSGCGAPMMAEGEGLFADDMSMDKVIEAANNQKNNQNEAQKVRTNRFKDLEMPTEGRDFSEEDCDSGVGAGDGDGEEGTGADEAGEEGGEGEGNGEVTGGSDGEGQEGGEGNEGDSGSLESDSGDSAGSEGSDPSETKEGSEGEGSGFSDGEVKGDSHDGKEEVITAPEQGEGVGRNGSGNSNALTGEGTADVNLETEVDELLEELAEMSDWEVQKMQDVAEGMVEDVPEFGEGQVDDSHAILVRREFVREENFQDQRSRYTDRYNQVKRLNRGGIKRIEKVMRNLVKGADTKFNTHKKRGKLDTKRLWSAASGASDKVFKTDKITPDFNAAVVVLIDASGSMGCSAGKTPSGDYATRASAAGEAAVTISESLEALGVDYEVVDFMSSYGRSKYGNLKTPAGLYGCTGITMRKAAHDKLTNEVKARIVAPNIGGENSDGYALEWAMKRCDMIAKEGQKKIVFVISDGQPAGPAPSGMSARSHLQRVLSKAEKEDYILFSVGIAGMDTSRYYANHGHARVTDTSKLGIEIVGPLKQCLKSALKKNR